jgi:hypothetical protein
MDKPKLMIAVIGKQDAPPRLGPPGMKGKMPMSPKVGAAEDLEKEESAAAKLAYLKGVLKECLEVLGEDEEGQAMGQEGEDGLA